MKKIIALSAFMVFIAASAFAATTADIAASAAITGKGPSAVPTVAMGKLSTNVSLRVTYDTTAYAAATKHLSGNRAFGTSYNDTKIFYFELAVGKAVTDITVDKSDSTVFDATGWVSL